MNRYSRISTARGAAALAEIATRAWQPVAEFALLQGDPVYWGWGMARGDGHSVMPLPGLGAGDGYLRAMRAWLRRVGYQTIRSGIERNPGWSEDLVADLGERVEAEHRRTGRRVTMIGHSMGGVLARSVAVRRPHAVDHVITLGSPLMMTRGELPDSVRMSAIYSRTDRIVRYPGATSRDTQAENIEVPGSHTGMAFNPEVYRQLARLLPAKAEVV
jgi:triacylglycerol lipase